MSIRTEHSTQVGPRARQLPRLSTGLQPLPDVATCSRPTRLDKHGRPVLFNNSEGYSEEVAGAWLANEIDAPLSGFHRHAAEMIDTGLCHTEDLF